MMSARARSCAAEPGGSGLTFTIGLPYIFLISMSPSAIFYEGICGEYRILREGRCGVASALEPWLRNFRNEGVNTGVRMQDGERGVARSTRASGREEPMPDGFGLLAFFFIPPIFRLPQLPHALSQTWFISAPTTPLYAAPPKGPLSSSFPSVRLASLFIDTLSSSTHSPVKIVPHGVSPYTASHRATPHRCPPRADATNTSITTSRRPRTRPGAEPLTHCGCRCLELSLLPMIRRTQTAFASVSCQTSSPCCRASSTTRRW